MAAQSSERTGLLHTRFDPHLQKPALCKARVLAEVAGKFGPAFVKVDPASCAQLLTNALENESL